MNKKGIRIGMVTAVVAVTFAMFTQCFSSHENDNGTSMMVEASGNAIETATEKELDEIMNRCSQVLENRLRSFCEEEPGLDKAKFCIKRVNDNKSIRIDFKNLELSQDQVTRVLKLLQSHGCLQFYETYRFNEICDCFFKANEKLAEKNDPSDIEDNVVVLFKGPLFRLLQPNFEQVAPGKFSAELNARVGTAQANDTAVINQMLKETKDYFPTDLKFAWTAKPIVIDENEVFELIALKSSQDNKSALSGETIKNVHQEYSSYNHAPEISIEMNNEGAKEWKRITWDNIGRQIAVVFDGIVYSYPIVNGEIPNGRSTICGGITTVEEAKDLVNIIKAGMLPVSVSVNVINK